MEMRTYFKSRRPSLIDVSFEDDSLIASSTEHPLDSIYSAYLENEELLEAITENKLEDTADSHDCRTSGCQPTKYLEISSTKATNQYNLNQSFAWDSAFFTSAGILEPEELSSIIESVDKSEKHEFKLHRIHKDLNRSSDSVSTLNDSLESLEADLFEDIRASIQKSHNKIPKEKGSSKLLTEASQSRIGHASKKMIMADHNKMKLKSASKNSSTILLVSGRTTKNPNSPQLSQKSVAKCKEPSLSKQPKVLQKSGPSSLSSKRESLGDLHIKSKNNNSRCITAGGSDNMVMSGTVGPVSKTPVVGGSHITTPKRVVSTKSSLGSSAATKARSSTSNSLAGKNGKPDNNSWKRKSDSANSFPHSCSSIVHTQLRFASRNKMQSEKSNLSASLKSVSRLSPCSSPASSTGEWSSESSTSTSTVTQKSSTSSTCLDTGSCQKGASDIKTPKSSDSQNLANKESIEWKRKKVTGYCNQSVNNASSCLSKPSGLRMPSPKIEFFDGGKILNSHSSWSDAVAWWLTKNRKEKY